MSSPDNDYYKLVLSGRHNILCFNDGDGNALETHDVSIIDASGNLLAKESVLDSGSTSTKIGSSGNYYVLVNNSLDTKDYSNSNIFRTSTSHNRAK